MRKKWWLPIAIMVVINMAVPSSARVSPEYYEWAQGNFRMPDPIGTARQSAELVHFLQSDKPFIRMAAVRRLVQIEGLKAIPTLNRLFLSEPDPKDIEGRPLVKLEIIRNLAGLRAPESRQALNSYTRAYWDQLPRTFSDNLFRITTFEPILGELLWQLVQHGPAHDVEVIIRAVALSDALRDPSLFSTSFRVNVWAAYLEVQMASSKIQDPKQKVKYLLSMMNEIFDAGKPGFLSLDHIRKLAVEELIARSDRNVVSMVEDQLGMELRDGEYRRQSDPARAANHIRRNIALLRKLAIGRAKDQKAGRDIDFRSILPE